MGADLCGYLMVGPLALPKPPEEALRKLAFELSQLYIAREGLPGAPLLDGLDNPDDWYEVANALGYDAVLLDTFFDECPTGTYPEETQQEIFEYLNKMVEDIRQAWTGEKVYRDATFRTVDVNGTKVRVFFAGERTWGDGPESGSAWYLFEQAHACKLLDLLEIR